MWHVVAKGNESQNTLGWGLKGAIPLNKSGDMTKRNGVAHNHGV